MTCSSNVHLHYLTDTILTASNSVAASHENGTPKLIPCRSEREREREIGQNKTQPHIPALQMKSARCNFRSFRTGTLLLLLRWSNPSLRVSEETRLERANELEQMTRTFPCFISTISLPTFCPMCCLCILLFYFFLRHFVARYEWYHLPNHRAE